MAAGGYQADIDPESGCRLPLPRRAELPDEAQAIFDGLADPNGRTSLRGLRGPGGITLHSPGLWRYSRGLNRYLRYEAGLGGRVREQAILTRAANSTASSNGRRMRRRPYARGYLRRSSRSCDTAVPPQAFPRPMPLSSSLAAKSSERVRSAGRPLRGHSRNSAAEVSSILSR